MPALQKWVMLDQVREERAGWPRELRGSDRVPSAVCAPLQTTQSTLLLLLCIFQLNFLHEEERGTRNPLAFVIMQTLRGVDCPSLHIINVSGCEWRVCYFFPSFCAETGRGRGAEG